MSRKYRKSSGGLWAVAVMTFVFVLALATGITAAFSKGFKDWSFWPWANVESKVFSSYENTAKITLSTAPATSSENGYIEQTITATVYPETAENKEVDWSCYWLDTTVTENVADYLTVTPTADGSNVAVLRCLAPFKDNIIVEVCTRQFGYKAYTTVGFIGKPTELNLVLNDELNEDDVYLFNSFQMLYFELIAENPFDFVSIDLDYDISYKAFGTLKTGFCDIETGEWFNFNTISYQSFLETNKQFSFGFDGTYLNLELFYSLDEFSQSWYNTSNEIAAYKKVYEVIEPCYVEFTLIEKNTGLTKSFKFSVINAN